MSVWNFPKDTAAVRQIREAADRGTLAHELLFTGTGEREALARFAAAAFECRAKEGRPCGICSACRKARQGIHPDIITVRDAAHKNTAVDVVRAARNDAYIRPNEGVCKVYLFPDCGLLTEQDQNVLLKIVEEGPTYAVFLFCAENPSTVLPTLRSRCVEIRLNPCPEKTGGELSENARALCHAVAEKKSCGPTEVLIRLERSKISRENLRRVLEETRSVFSAALLILYGQSPNRKYVIMAGELAKNLTRTQIMRTIELLQKYGRECLYNVGPGQVLGALAVGLEGIL